MCVRKANLNNFVVCPFPFFLPSLVRSAAFLSRPIGQMAPGRAAGRKRNEGPGLLLFSPVSPPLSLSLLSLSLSLALTSLLSLPFPPHVTAIWRQFVEIFLQITPSAWPFRVPLNLESKTWPGRRNCARGKLPWETAVAKKCIPVFSSLDGGWKKNTSTT